MPKGIPINGVNKGWFRKGEIPLTAFKEGLIPWNKGKTGYKLHSEEYKERVSKMMKGNKWRLGDILSDETKTKMSDAHIGFKHTEESKRKMSVAQSGVKHYRWNPNREEVRYDRRNDPEYKQWRKRVWERDKFKCKISNQGCKGRIEAHHILVWRDYPKLRYDINNGITLCQFHHPRKRSEEQRLIPTFQELVGSNR